MSKLLPTPTEAELEILQVLWRRGPQSVQKVWEEFGGTGAYTTTLKLLQIMHEKGLVRRDESQMTHIYEAAIAERDNQKQMVEGLIDRVFGGSVSELVLRALSSKAASPKELAAIRSLLNEASKKKGKRG